MADTSQLSRGRIGETTEFRHEAPLWLAQVLQATAQARGKSRAGLVNEILEAYAKERLLEATLVLRMTRGNTDIPEFLPVGPEA